LTGGFDEILSQLMGEVTDELLQARAFKTKVQPEIDDDFPTLHAHSLLGLWGALESLVEDLFMGMLSLKPTLLQNEQFSRFKLPITAMAGPEDARSQSILDAVAKDLGTNLLTGAGQFEALLKHVGLDGGLTDKLRRALVESQKIRHVWAHRAGIADERFLIDNPSAQQWQLGERVNVGAEQYNRYLNGIAMYASLLQRRYMESHIDSGLPVLKDSQSYEGTLAELFPKPPSAVADGA
jgi:hypothetical protein